MGCEEEAFKFLLQPKVANDGRKSRYVTFLQDNWSKLTAPENVHVFNRLFSGKYAQVLKSSSHVIPPKPIPTTIHKQAKSSKSPSASIEPTVLEDGLPLEALFTAPVGQNLVRHSRRPAVSPPFKNRLQRTKTSTPPPPPPTPTDPPQPTKRPASQRASFK